MWTTDYKYKNVRGVIISGGMGHGEELIAFDVGYKDVVDLILRRDPVIFDFLVDALMNVKDLADLMWADEDYYVEYVMPHKYENNLDELKERITYLISVAPKYEGTENAVRNLGAQLQWFEKQKEKAIRKEAGRVTRRKLQSNYDSLFMAIGRRDGFKCVVCGISENLSIDHKIAIINGGTNDLENLQLMCRSHNSAKGAR